MPITLKKDVWKVKDPSSGQYRGAAILSTTLPQDAAQIISESNTTIQNIKDTAINAVDTALNDERTGLIPKAEADRDAIDDSLNNATNGIIPTAQSDRDDIDDSLNNINDGIIPEAQANLATIAAAVQSQIGQGTDKTLSVAKGFADAKAAGMLVKVSNYQPGSQLDDPATSQDTSQNTGYPVYKDSNRVWVKETYTELEVPTMDDVDELKSAFDDVTTVNENNLYNKYSTFQNLFIASSGSVIAHDASRTYIAEINGTTGDLFSAIVLSANDYLHYGIANGRVAASNAPLVAGDTVTVGAFNYQNMRGQITLATDCKYLFFCLQFDSSENASNFDKEIGDYLVVTQGNYPSEYAQHIVVPEDALSLALSSKINTAYDLVSTGYYNKTELVTPGNYVVGIYNSNGVLNSSLGIHALINVNPGEKYYITGNIYSTSGFPLVVEYDGSNNVIGYDYATGVAGSVIDYLYTVPQNVYKININGKAEIFAEKLSEKTTEDFAIPALKGKKILWLGTSIPEGDRGKYSYPFVIGNMLGATVYNEALGNSGVHCRQESRVDSTTNPYGFIGNFTTVSRCLSNDIEMNQWIIDNWNSDIWTYGKPSSMTDALAQQILGYSYENKIGKYLTPENIPDLIVFDHGHNDQFNGSLETENTIYTERGQYDTFSFHGAMNMLIRYIKNYAPYVPVIMVGEYTGKDTDFVPAMQLQVADDWDIPLYKSWENLGWSKTKEISASGAWVVSPYIASRYDWVENSTPINMSLFDRWLPDHVHPASDNSRKAVLHYAEKLYKWLTQLY